MTERLGIGKLASLLNANPKTIRYYEELGIVSPERATNGYRLFSDGDMDRLRFAFRAKRLGLTLREIKMLLEYAKDRRCETVKASVRQMVAEKITELDERIRGLSNLQKDLKAFLIGGKATELAFAGAEGCACLERED